MAVRKIFNDPIYGLISYPSDLVYTLIDHPYFQRLRRIEQLGMSSVVYPGATHTRFHHALGATHLCDRLLTQLRRKGVEITDEEYDATLVAILLHDIGHGPYSHALEGEIIPLHHEDISTHIIGRLDEELDGRLALAKAVFDHKYHKTFLSQMISGQVDVDRMDYLCRDSFYTGVAEGIIGYDRIIKMMDVRDNRLVVEEKGIHSVEKFLLSRYFMYQQVYLHHASLSADHMLKMWLSLYKQELRSGNMDVVSQLDMTLVVEEKNVESEGVNLFLDLDDTDVIQAIKRSRSHNNEVLSILSQNIINRRLHAIETQASAWKQEEISRITTEVSQDLEYEFKLLEKMINLGQESVRLYDHLDEIAILQKKSGEVVTLSSISRLNLRQTPLDLFFITYPKKDS